MIGFAALVVAGSLRKSPIDVMNAEAPPMAAITRNLLFRFRLRSGDVAILL
jgi:hypothetical protein